MTFRRLGDITADLVEGLAADLIGDQENEAARHRAEAADEMVEGLLSTYKRRSVAFSSGPTEQSWNDLVMAKTAYHVASFTEENR
jgi:hypothetical protein